MNFYKTSILASLCTIGWMIGEALDKKIGGFIGLIIGFIIALNTKEFKRK
jgi:cobalamin synthase